MSEGRTILSGDLSIVSLASVFQLVEAECITGRLELEAGGVVSFFAGRPVGAKYGPAEGVPAILDAFVREPASFTLTTAAVAQGPAVGAVLGLIMEGCRLSDEWKRLAFQVLAVGHRERVAALGPVAQALAQQLNGGRAVELAVDRAGLPRSAAVDPLLAMIDEGVVHEVTSPPPPLREHGPLSVAGFSEAMELGRQALRNGAYADAAVAFEAAVALRPEDRVAAQNLRRVRELQGASDNPFGRWTRR